jgi:hypothetical protein
MPAGDRRAGHVTLHVAVAAELPAGQVGPFEAATNEPGQCTSCGDAMAGGRWAGARESLPDVTHLPPLLPPSMK